MTTSLYNIDESHGLSHSMNVFLMSNDIYRHEVINTPILWGQHRIIYTSAILHDTCDRKYMDKEEGLERIREFLKDKFSKNDIDIILQIISTMSYSYVSKYGYPDLDKYQMAYHIVREADLLTAYDINRALIYDMHINNTDIVDSYENTKKLFERRMFKHFEHDLFVTEYSKNLAKMYEMECYDKIQNWNELIREF